MRRIKIGAVVPAVMGCLMVVGCSQDELPPDTCHLAQTTLENCGTQVPSGFTTKCQANPSKFNEILSTPCDKLANGTRGTQSSGAGWNGQGDDCSWNWTCSDFEVDGYGDEHMEMVCVPTRVEHGDMQDWRCHPRQDEGGLCDNGHDCRQGLACRDDHHYEGNVKRCTHDHGEGHEPWHGHDEDPWHDPEQEPWHDSEGGNCQCRVGYHTCDNWGPCGGACECEGYPGVGNFE